MMNDSGPPGASNNGFNENLTLFQSGQVRHVDRRHRGGLLRDQSLTIRPGRRSASASRSFPDKEGLGQARQLALGLVARDPDARTDAPEAAKKFVEWATSKEYTEHGGLQAEGWANGPAGNADIALRERQLSRKPRPSPPITLRASIERRSDTQHPTVKDHGPLYGRSQFVAIPEFQGIGTAVGQQFSAALAGTTSIDDALAAAQDLTNREMEDAGYK